MALWFFKSAAKWLQGAPCAERHARQLRGLLARARHYLGSGQYLKRNGQKNIYKLNGLPTEVSRTCADVRSKAAGRGTR